MQQIFISLFILLVSSNTLLAAPQINLCFNDCKSTKQYRLSDTAWKDLKTLFEEKNITEQTEREKLAAAIALIELDILSNAEKYKFKNKL